jgi:hypothetical protein
VIRRSYGAKSLWLAGSGSGCCGRHAGSSRSRATGAAAALLWVLWALWHAPLGFHGPVGRGLATYVQQRVVSLFLLAIVLTWLYNRSGGNLLTVAIFHAGTNAFPLVLAYSPISFALFGLWTGYAARWSEVRDRSRAWRGKL